MSTYIGASAEPVLFFSLSFSSFFYTYMGYPLRPHAQPNRHSLFDRDFRPVIPALGGRRLSGHLDG